MSNKRGTDNVLETEIVQNCAQKYGRSPVQVVLNWNLMRGCPVIPNSSNFDRQTENFNSFDFKIEEGDVEAITKLNNG